MVNNLTETIELMTSDDYKDRFKAEFYQLEYRVRKLNDMLKSWENGTLNFTPTCTKKALKRQLAAMQLYLMTLQQRAKTEEIDL